MKEERKVGEIIQEILNKTGKDKIFIIILIGVLLMIVALPTKKSTSAFSTTFASSSKDEQTADYSEKLKQIIGCIKGVGEVEVLVKMDDQSNVTGVMIVCEGGDDSFIVTELTEAVNSLFGVPAHKVKVLKMSNY